MWTAASTDFVHWEDRGVDVLQRNETFGGMKSFTSPCSGFVTADEKGRVCAGFRQCSSSHGVTDLNPAARAWDVPLELRCATNENLTEWGETEFIYDVYYWRALPYEPGESPPK